MSDYLSFTRLIAEWQESYPEPLPPCRQYHECWRKLQLVHISRIIGRTQEIVHGRLACPSLAVVYTFINQELILRGGISRKVPYSLDQVLEVGATSRCICRNYSLAIVQNLAPEI